MQTGIVITYYCAPRLHIQGKNRVTAWSYYYVYHCVPGSTVRRKAEIIHALWNKEVPAIAEEHYWYKIARWIAVRYSCDIGQYLPVVQGLWLKMVPTDWVLGRGNTK
jgi:hypothetical protein